MFKLTYIRVALLLIASVVIVFGISFYKIVKIESIVKNETSYSSLMDRTFGGQRYSVDKVALYNKAVENKVKLKNGKYAYLFYPVNEVSDFEGICSEQGLKRVSIVNDCYNSYLKSRSSDLKQNKQLMHPVALSRRVSKYYSFDKENNQYDGRVNGLKQVVVDFDVKSKIISKEHPYVYVTYYIFSRWLWGSDSQTLKVLESITRHVLENSSDYLAESYVKFEYDNDPFIFGDYIHERRGLLLDGVETDATSYCATLVLREEIVNKILISAAAVFAMDDDKNVNVTWKGVLGWLFGMDYFHEVNYSAFNKQLEHLSWIYTRIVKMRNHLPILGKMKTSPLAFGKHSGYYKDSAFRVVGGNSIGICTE